MRSLRRAIPAGLAIALAACGRGAGTPADAQEEPAMTMEITSPAVEPGAPIPRRFTGDGEDVSPPLAWSEPPPGTRELALICDDPDAPSGEPWVHWVIYGLPAESRALPEGVDHLESPAEPKGAHQGMNSWGAVGYRGPAPPKGHGTHHYHFTLYALDAPLGLRARADKKTLLRAMKGHVLASGELVGTYAR